MPKTPNSKSADKKMNVQTRVRHNRAKGKGPMTGRDVSVRVDVRFDGLALHLPPKEETTATAWLKETALYCIKALLMFFHL